MICVFVHLSEGRFGGGVPAELEGGCRWKECIYLRIDWCVCVKESAHMVDGGKVYVYLMVCL